MASSRSEVRSSFTRVLGFVLVGLVGGFSLATCGGDPAEDPAGAPGLDESEIELTTLELKESECNRNGNTSICHYDSSKRKFVKQSVNSRACCSHVSHSKDYFAGNDSNCSGCTQLNKACKKSSECCSGTQCIGGKCKAPPVCLPQGAICVQLGTPLCCSNSCLCSNPSDPSTCRCQ